MKPGSRATLAPGELDCSAWRPIHDSPAPGAFLGPKHRGHTPHLSPDGALRRVVALHGATHGRSGSECNARGGPGVRPGSKVGPDDAQSRLMSRRARAVSLPA